ncbi:sigma-54 interaction domain-containing protein [Inediibacterium massiliense]|uniref:sigma-54 interaction domain-containing protein n=1 Tax=Inediibacterium massiliense TaxID=1658111 RepID=UPI0006B5EE02|nr:sigma 54-interacting transcriptional regulator [Inediibacterium massiliense]
MVSLLSLQPTLEKIVNSLSNIIHVEVAIFDRHYHLITSTKNYLDKKGNTVHTPSLEEVLYEGNVLVNKPGYMKSCIGCRFKDHCPATIEILSCIHLKNDPIGVIALTSFTKEGHDILLKNIETYLNLLKEISDLIGMIAFHRSYKNKIIHLNTSLQTIIDLSKKSTIIIDKKGLITHSNDSALKLFSFCNLYTHSLDTIFPLSLVEDILEGIPFSKKYVKNKSLEGFISSYPIQNNNSLEGAIIAIDQKTPLNKDIKIELSNSLDRIKGNSKSILHVKNIIKKISKSTSSVLITGETGTGKELLAKAIHENSNRAKLPIISINCASIPDSLFESELFGYEEGAFTGAKKGGKIGRIELAQGGTLFLDEIGELPLFMQSKLLRVLQEHSIEKVGGTKSIPINVRIIAATNRNLEEMIEKKEFRADLYYRLNVIPLKISPLRHRKEDIEILALDFLKKYSHQLGKHLVSFSDDALNLFINYDWPGNVRELENAIEYAVNMEDDSIIHTHSLPHSIIDAQYIPKNQTSIKGKIKELEIEVIKATLDQYGWDVAGKTKTAKELGIGLRTLYRKLKDFESI